MNLSDIIWLPLVIIGGLFLGIGVARVWYSKTNIKKPRIRGEKRTYYTRGEVWMMKIKSEIKEMLHAKDTN